MLAINGYPYVPPADSFFILQEYGGAESLQFDIHPKDPLYAQVAEEVPVTNDGARYLIKAINERPTVSTVSCALDLDVFKVNAYQTYSSETRTLTALLDDLTPAGWTHEGDSAITIRRTIELQSCTDYDIIQQAAKTYGVEFSWDTKNCVLRVVRPDTFEPAGVYLTDELNLTNLCFKGSSSGFATRLYPYGKDGLNIAAVNNELEYVEDHTYSDKIISVVWQDERYTVPENLRDDAIERLRKMAYPARSYTCNVADLAKASDRYRHLQFELYGVVTLLDRERGTRINHQIVSYKQYPMRPVLNVVTLSSIPERITGTSVAVSIAQAETRVAGRINEVRQDVDSNSALLKETYTVGETDAKIESLIQQGLEDFRVEMSETYTDRETATQQVSTLNQTVEDLTVRLSTRGGRNLLKGTAFYDLDSWTLSEGGAATATRDRADLYQTESGGAAVITSGSLTQTVRVVPGGQYCWRLRYRLTGTLTSQAVLSVAGVDIDLDLADAWTELSGTFVASDQSATVSLSNATGSLFVADLILTSGLEASVWQLAQNEIMSDEMYFANGKLGVGASGSPLRTAITNTQFSVENTETGERVIYAGVGGAELDRTVIRKSLTVQAEGTSSGAYTVLPIGNGHVLHTIGD